MGSTLTVDNIVGATTAANVKLPAGSILQTLSTTKIDDHFQSATTSFVDVTGVTLTITPKYNTSKILITVSGAFSHNTSSRLSLFNLVRGSTAIGLPTSAKTNSATRAMYHNGTDQLHQLHIEFLDSPATTSATTYKLQWRNSSSTTYINKFYDGGTNYGGSSTITAMEVSA